MPGLKGKSSYYGLVAVAGGLLWAASAHASERVLLLQAPGQAGSGLEGALGVQLVGVAELEVRPLPEAASVPLRIDAARELGQRQDALLVVWSEEPVALPDGSKEAVLYAVGQHEGRALLEVVRVPGGQGPDMDRTLALKVRELVDGLHRARAQSPSAAMLQADAATQPMTATRPRLGASAALSALGDPGLSARPARLAADVALGPSLLLRDLRLSALATLRWYPQRTVQQDGGTARFDELAPGLTLHSQLRAGPLWLGARSGLALAFTSASGETAARAGGKKYVERTALWQLGLDVELPLTAELGLRAGLELTTRFVHRRLSVNDVTVVDLGRVSPLASIGIAWSVPPYPSTTR
jgi:hypothetical protein